MNRYLPIRRVYAREVLDSRGNPTVEVEVTVGEGVMSLEGYTARAMVPSGASTGKYEAVELRDKDKERFGGKGVTKAVEHVNEVLGELIVGENALEQMRIDRILCEADGTSNKEKYGANAILGISMAVAKACAKALRIPVYQYLGGVYTRALPMPMMNILNGGKHADNTVDLQEFMIIPKGAGSFMRGLVMCTEVYHKLKELLNAKGLSTGVGDEGGFAPDLRDAREVLQLMMEAVIKAGYEPGNDIVFAIDAAASELYQEGTKIYYFPGESMRSEVKVERNTDDMITFYESLLNDFPIVSIEDPLYEDDWDGWEKITKVLGERVQLVGDDLFVTNTNRLKAGIIKGAANAILIKVNQIGTLTEAIEAIDYAHKAGYRAVISHRSGETEDDFIADLAVAFNCGQIKTGAPCRAERTAKYNRLLRIADSLGDEGVLRNPFEKSIGKESL